MTQVPLARVVCIALAAALAVACDPAPNNPIAPNPNAGTPPAVQPQLREVRILGAPSAVHFGAVADLKAVAAYSDGTFVDVTSSATWQSSHAACRVVGPGRIEAVGGGVADVTAESAGLTTTAVSIACGHFITLTTHENFPTEHVAVPGVVGEILDGALAGHRFVTDANGRAALPPAGEPGFTIHFKKPGFENYAHRVVQLPRETSLGIPMVPEFTARVAFEGRCSTEFEQLVNNYTFTTGRTGKIRLRVDLQSNGLTPFAWLLGNIEGIVGQVGELATVHERPLFEPNRPVVEMRVGAGDYQMSLTAVQGCSPTDFWRATLEYSR